MSGAESVRQKLGRDFTRLAGLAGFILENASEEFAGALLRLYEELEVPMLRFYSQSNHEERLRALQSALDEMLGYISRDETNAFIDKAIQDWRNNELPVIQIEQVQAYDITLHNYAKGRALQIFVSRYTDDLRAQMALQEEIERFILILDSELFTVYMEFRKQELRDVNQRLRNRERQLVEAQEVGHVGSFEWDFVGRRLSLTPYVHTILENPPPQTLDEFLHLVHPDDREKLRSAVESAIETGEFVCEFRYVGSQVPKVILSRGKVEMESGRLSRMLGTVFDITERSKMYDQLKENEHELRERERYLRQLNMSLERANRELRRTNEELESFNFIASHDLQEPLRKIQVYSDRILEHGKEALSPPLRQHFEKILKASGRMQKLIEDFLIFSQTLKTAQPDEVVNMKEIVDEVVQEFAPRIEEKGGKVEVGPLPTVFGIRFQIKQLMVNLVSNALKYTFPGIAPLITISHSTVRGADITHDLANPVLRYHCFAVADNGIGFDPKYKKRIFELFQRLHNRETYSGTGIGLALCKKIAQNMGGFIDVDSTPDQGSIFRVYIPIDDTSSVVEVDPVQRTEESR